MTTVLRLLPHRSRTITFLSSSSSSSLRGTTQIMRSISTTTTWSSTSNSKHTQTSSSLSSSKSRISRSKSTTASSSSAVSVIPPPPSIVVLRQDVIYPNSMSTYEDIVVSSVNSSDDDNDNHNDFLRFVSRPILGGDLNTVTHAEYYAGGLNQWQQSIMNDCDNNNNNNDTFNSTTTTTRTMLGNVMNQWQTDEMTSCIQSQQSTVYVEAPFIQQFDEISGLANLNWMPPSTSSTNSTSTPSTQTIFEIRTYNLKLGYDTVPKFLQLYQDGLPSKLHASGTHHSTSLVTLLYSEVGRLNQVIEIWIHNDGVDAMEQSRVAARSAQPWRIAIAQIAELAIEFHSTVHKPMFISS